MNIPHRLLVPEYLQIELQQMGLVEEFVFWQYATDYLRDTHGTYIVVFPVEKADKEPYIIFDFSILSPFGQNWESADRYEDYYEALEVAIVESINCIKEGYGTARFGNIRPGEVPSIEGPIQQGEENG